MTVFLTLGEVVFSNFEVPQSINFGGEQALALKKFVGGRRQIDAMGRDDDDISFSGLMFESTASFRAQYLDNMRMSGAQIPLSWGIFNYLVVIKSFKANFQRTYQIPYSITCTVVQNLNNPLPILLPVGYNDAIANIMTELNDLAVLIANPSVTSSMALIASALNDIPSVQNASATALIPLLTSIISSQAVVSSVIASKNKELFGS